MARRVVSIEPRGPEVPVHDDPLDVLERGCEPRFAVVGQVAELRADGRSRKLAAGEVRLPRRLSQRKVRAADAGRWLRGELPGAVPEVPQIKRFAEFFWELFLPRLGLGFSKVLQRRGGPRPMRGAVIPPGRPDPMPLLSTYDGRCGCGGGALFPPLLGLQLALGSLEPPPTPRFDPCARARLNRPDHQIQTLTAPATLKFSPAVGHMQVFADGAGELRLERPELGARVEVIRIADGPPIVVRGADLEVELRHDETVQLEFDGDWVVTNRWRR